jgi:hypothetical protein
MCCLMGNLEVRKYSVGLSNQPLTSGHSRVLLRSCLPPMEHGGLLRCSSVAHQWTLSWVRKTSSSHTTLCILEPFSYYYPICAYLIPLGFLLKILFPCLVANVPRPVWNLTNWAFWHITSPHFVFRVQKDVCSQLGGFDRVVIDSRFLLWNCFYCKCALIFQSVTSDLVHCEYKGLDNGKMCTILYVGRRVLVSKHDCHHTMNEIL